MRAPVVQRGKKIDLKVPWKLRVLRIEGTSGCQTFPKNLWLLWSCGWMGIWITLTLPTKRRKAWARKVDWLSVKFKIGLLMHARYLILKYLIYFKTQVSFSISIFLRCGQHWDNLNFIWSLSSAKFPYKRYS